MLESLFNNVAGLKAYFEKHLGTVVSLLLLLPLLLLRPFQRSVMERSCTKAPSWMFDMVLNTPPSLCSVA